MAKELLCQEGHELIKSDPCRPHRTLRYVCNLCETLLDTHERWACHLCDFDLCQDCVDRQQEYSIQLRRLLGKLEKAGRLVSLGSEKKALCCLKECTTHLAGLEPKTTDIWRYTSDALSGYFRQLGKNQRAQEANDKALDVHIGLLPALENRQAAAKLAMEDTFLLEGNSLFWDCAYAEALEKYKRSLALAKEHESAGGDVAFGHCCIARTLYPLEGISAALEECEKAKALCNSLEVQSDPKTVKETQLLLRSLKWLKEAGEEAQQESNVDPQDSSPEKTSNLVGVSVEYLQTTFLAEVIVAGHTEDSSIYDIENLAKKETPGVIRRKGANRVSLIDGRLGSSYVHCLRGKDVGVATFMLSYSWR